MNWPHNLFFITSPHIFCPFPSLNQNKENGYKHRNLMTVPVLSLKGDSFNCTLLCLNALLWYKDFIFTLSLNKKQKKVDSSPPDVERHRLNPLLSSYLLKGCRGLQPNVRHKHRWWRPAWPPLPGSLATSLFHSGDWTCWRNERSLCRGSAHVWRAKDAVPVTAAAQEEKSPWIHPRAGRQKGKAQTQQLPREREPGCSLLSQP